MSKARVQSATRRTRRIASGFQSEMPSSTKVAPNARGSTTVYRTNKFVVELPKKRN